MPHLGVYPLIAFSHSSWGHRRQATFLCTYLTSHGYVVAAVDHLGNTIGGLAQIRRGPASGGETSDRRAARLQVLRAACVPDIRCVLDHLLTGRRRARTAPPACA
jgi:predicted dienelactone hydrolase